MKHYAQQLTHNIANWLVGATGDMNVVRFFVYFHMKLKAMQRQLAILPKRCAAY